MRGIVKPWPSDDQMDRLVEISHGLFIFAACVARFVDNHSYAPNDQLEMVLRFRLSAYSELDQLFLQSLHQCADTESLRLVLGTILVLSRPVIWILLRAQISIEQLRAILHLLRSVLYVPEDERRPVMIFHQSFHDFLLDERRSGETYWIDRDIYAINLADSCHD